MRRDHANLCLDGSGLPSWKGAFHTRKTRGAHGAGSLTPGQVRRLLEALEHGQDDPALACDLEGCGPVAELEHAFTETCGTRFALALSSGTAAIHTALLAAGVGAGDEVIVTPYSWPQSVSPVLFTGAVPVFADIDPDTLTMDPGSVCERISPRTRAIVPVHLFGNAADMGRLEEISRERDIPVISDAAHALGAKCHGRPVGARGKAACFSLTRGKIASGGEGGVLVTDDEDLYVRAVALSQHPDRLTRIMGPAAPTAVFGLNYRMHPLAAVLALADMEELQDRLAWRRAIHEAVRDGLGAQGAVGFPRSLQGTEGAAYGIPLTCAHGIDREGLASRLAREGIPLRCGPVKTPLHTRLRDAFGVSAPFHPTHAQGSCPHAERRCDREELWLLSGLDMDRTDPAAASSMARRIREICAVLGRDQLLSTRYGATGPRPAPHGQGREGHVMD